MEEMGMEMTEDETALAQRGRSKQQDSRRNA
jgi:hypothetical protein